MARFELRRPIITREPIIVVDPGLEPGVYQFSLVVTDAAGNESQPDVRTVRIQRPLTERPTIPDRPTIPIPERPNILIPNPNIPGRVIPPLNS